MDGQTKLFAPDGTAYTEAPEILSFRNLDSREPTIVLISGACTALPWIYGGTQSIAAQLHAAGRDVIVLEIPGFRQTHEVLNQLVWRNVVRDFKFQLVEPLEQRRKLKLVGYSLGACVAIELAADTTLGQRAKFHHPTQELVLLNPIFVLNNTLTQIVHRLRVWLGTYTSPPMHTPQQRSWFLETLMWTRHGNEIPVSGIYRRSALRYPALAAEFEIKGPLSYDHWPTAALCNYIAQIAEIRRLLWTLRCPIRIVQSEFDVLGDLGGKLEDLINPDALKTAKLELWKGLGHLGLMCEPQRAVQAILS